MNRNSNANSNANVNANANATTTPVIANANANSRAPTREEYERDAKRYSREARESGRTVGTGLNDGWIWVKARFELAADDDLRDSTINADVENGVVTLSGTVLSEADQRRALAIVKNIEGVKAVRDHLSISTISPSPSPLATPSLVPTPSASPTPTATLIFDIDREVQKLREGTAITEVPTSMELDETRIVVLVLSPSTDKAATMVAEQETREELKRRSEQAPAKKLESTTKIETDKAKYSSFMEAKLSGQGFEIKPITEERQPVTSAQPTKWSWEIKAKMTGDQYLYLALNAIFESEGANKTAKTRSVNTLSKAVTVNVAWSSRMTSFIANNWQWFMAAILIPLITWAGPKLWWLMNKKPKKKKR